MTKRTFVILIILVISLLGGAYWYFSQKTLPSSQKESFPGGSGVRNEGTQKEGGLTEGESVSFPENMPLPRLYKLHDAPVAGVGFYEEKDKKGVILNTRVRYIEKGVGHIFETTLDAYTETRIANETHPRIAEALWGNSGKSVVIRFLDNKDNGIKTRIINLATSTESISGGLIKTEELYLPDAIPFMATAGDNTDKLFYLEGETGSVATFKNTGVAEVFSSVFTEWLPEFPNQNLVTLTTRPSADVPGHLFFLNPSTKEVSKAIGGIKGLTTLTSHDGKFVVYSETTNSGPSLSLYSTTKKEKSSLFLQSFADKCVWGTKNPSLLYCAIPQALTNATYPDQWYQGLVSFSDSLWVIEAATNDARKVLTPKDLNAPNLDMTNLALSSDDSYLVFIDKTTGKPWLYSFNEHYPPSQKLPIAATSSATTTQTVSTSSATSSRAIEATSTKTSVAPSVIAPGMQKLK